MIGPQRINPVSDWYKKLSKICNLWDQNQVRFLVLRVLLASASIGTVAVCVTKLEYNIYTSYLPKQQKYTPRLLVETGRSSFRLSAIKQLALAFCVCLPIASVSKIIIQPSTK